MSKEPKGDLRCLLCKEKKPAITLLEFRNPKTPIRFYICKVHIQEGEDEFNRIVEKYAHFHTQQSDRRAGKHTPPFVGKQPRKKTARKKRSGGKRRGVT